MKEIKRVSITDAVVDSIREMIENEEYKVGEKLPTEAKICEALKVSRTSVREAIRILQAQGYIETKLGKGAFVAANHRADADLWYEVENPKFSDFMEVRMAIETLAVRVAIKKATPRDIKRLEEIQAEFVKASECKDLENMIVQDETFHTRIMKITQNQLLININKQLLKAFRFYRTESFTNQSVYNNAIEPHEAILDCFRKHDAVGGVEKMREHLRITENDMKQIHSKTKEKQS